MSSYLLDTHIVLWACDQEELLSPKVRDIFMDDTAQLYLSMASVWEMAIKISLDKLKLGCSLSSFIEDHILDNHISLLNVKTHHCYQVEQLPFFHRDPFDRMIIAQSIKERLPIISKDSAFRKYDVETLF